MVLVYCLPGFPFWLSRIDWENLINVHDIKHTKLFGNNKSSGIFPKLILVIKKGQIWELRSIVLLLIGYIQPIYINNNQQIEPQ